MKNQLIDLNNHLFAQIERLGDEGLKPAELALEVDRARAICGVSNQIVSNASLVLNAAKFKAESSRYHEMLIGVDAQQPKLGVQNNG